MDNNNPSRIKNSIIAGISIFTGIVGLIIVLAALFLGLQLGNQFEEQRGIIIVCFVTASAPISLAIMLTLALSIMGYIRGQNEASGEINSNEEDIT